MRHLEELLRQVISPSADFFPAQDTTTHKNEDNTHALRRIQTHNPRVPELKAHAPDRGVNATSC
jgi:hypothetical protein